MGRGSVPPPRLSPHTGRAAAACSGSRGPGGRRGQVCCSPTLLLAASGSGERKRELGVPKAHWCTRLIFSMGDAIYCPEVTPTSPAPPWGFGCSEGWGMPALTSPGWGSPLNPQFLRNAEGRTGSTARPSLGLNNPNAGGCLCPLCPARGHVQVPCGAAGQAQKDAPLAWAMRGPPATPEQGVTTQRQPSRGMGHEAGAALGVSWSHLFLNVNGAGVRHGGCVAGETRRHMVKAGAEAARGHGDMHTSEQTGGPGGLAACERVREGARELPPGTG